MTAALAMTVKGEDWRKHAACAIPFVDPELFWPIGTTGPAYERSVREARNVCAGCPVLTDCLTWALDHPREAGEGIYAGTTPQQRENLRRRP